MRRAKHAVIVLLGMLACAVPARYLNSPVAQAAQAKTQKKEVKVWVNTASGVYHCPGTRWYGSTKHGKYMAECAAIRDGNRPAYGKACGSDCQSVEITAPLPHLQPRKVLRLRGPSRPGIQI